MTIPDELKRSTPRSVALTRSGKTTVLFFVLLLPAVIAEGAWEYAHPGAPRSLLQTAGVIGLCFLFAIAGNLWRVSRQMRLLSYGRGAVARTTGEFRRVRFTSRHTIRRYRLQCEFTLLNGATCKTMVESGPNLPGANTEIVIVYDPDEPKKAMLYPALMLTLKPR
jgi:hypothetical protein